MALTVTVKLLVALKCCELTALVFVSVTTVVNTLVLGTWPVTGVHVITPLASIAALVGLASKTYASGLTGTSKSVAVFVTTRLAKPAVVRLPWAGNTGAVFTSFTVTVKLLVALRPPLSLTTVVIVFIPGPCASFGVHVMTPLALIVAFVGEFKS